MTEPFFFDPPSRILLGPGPSEVPSRVLAALSRPTVGYLDSSYTRLLETLQPQLRRLFGCSYEHTLTITGPGTAAMEAALVNVLEPGDPCVVCIHGYFGDRMAQIAERAGALVHRVEAPWGQPTSVQAVADKLASVGTVKALCVVHGETSTGVRQDIPELSELARRHDALLIVDTVASLGGSEFLTEAWDVDVAYSAAQKCLSVPPGISPITFGPRAMDAISRRTTPVRSWALDLALNWQIWDTPHRYHHTGAINLAYALHEGLNVLEGEGLATRISRTRKLAQALWAGCEAMGLGLLVAAEHRLTTLSTVAVPTGIDEAKVRADLMARYGIEIAGGLGPFAGKVWRVGLMGASATTRNLMLLLAGLEQALVAQNFKLSPGAAVQAAAARL